MIPKITKTAKYTCMFKKWSADGKIEEKRFEISVTAPKSQCKIIDIKDPNIKIKAG
jgi:hypothetical protein